VSQHCLYCDRPLALLKRLTGDGEFCSAEHRKIYKKEHNQLALARLLDFQSGSRGRLRTNNAENSKPEPDAAPPVREPEERQPGRAGFIHELLCETSALSVVDRSTGVGRVWSEPPVLGEYLAAKSSPKPKTAGFLAAPPAPIPGAGNTFPGKPLLEPLAVRQQLVEALRSEVTSVGIRRQPAEARFVAERPPEAVPSKAASGATRQLSAPFFSPLAAKMGEGRSRGGRPRKLLPNAFLPVSVVGARTMERLRGPATEPRWKSLDTALPAQPIGTITFVLGSLLRRPVHVAGQDRLPEIFEIRVRSISFPRYSPRMGILEERTQPTDRIGCIPT